MEVRNSSRKRLDLHNSNIDFDAAIAGRCGVTHLQTGRVCQLPHRHQSPCQLQSRHRAAERATRSLLNQPLLLSTRRQ